MASQLPAFPRLVFTVLEPISLLAGWLPAAFSPAWFMGEQLPGSLKIEHATAHSLVVTRQLGNCYLLAFLVAVAVLYSTNEIKVVRNYLVALWIADITHVLTTALALGYEGTVQVRGWNPTTWGNIGATVSADLSTCTGSSWLARAIREGWFLCLESRADGGCLPRCFYFSRGVPTSPAFLAPTCQRPRMRRSKDEDAENLWGQSAIPIKIRGRTLQCVCQSRSKARATSVPYICFNSAPMANQAR